MRSRYFLFSENTCFFSFLKKIIKTSDVGAKYLVNSQRLVIISSDFSVIFF